MAKYNNGELYNTGVLYGPAPQYLLDVGNIPIIAALGMPTVNPGPVTIQGVGNIPTGGACGTFGIFLIPKKLALGINMRHLSAVPQIRRLQVTPNG